MRLVIVCIPPSAEVLAYLPSFRYARIRARNRHGPELFRRLFVSHDGDKIDSQRTRKEVVAMQDVSAGITEQLAAWSRGDSSALEKLLPLIERELHQIAHRQMRREHPGHTLQTTALVNEAYL